MDDCDFLSIVFGINQNLFVFVLLMLSGNKAEDKIGMKIEEIGVKPT